MAVPEEWSPRPGFAPRALQNPAYRPADTLISFKFFGKSGPNPRLAYHSLTLNNSDVDCAPKGLHPFAVPLTPISSHDIPNHPVDGVF